MMQAIRLSVFRDITVIPAQAWRCAASRRQPVARAIGKGKTEGVGLMVVVKKPFRLRSVFGEQL
jgi:hypothetical protein